MTRDAYDEAIDYLRNNPDQIHKVWAAPHRKGGILFQFAVREGSTIPNEGCLTMIANPGLRANAETPELTEAIRNDVRIPHRSDDITIESLEVFAEWQRRIDNELWRPAPEWNEVN